MANFCIKCGSKLEGDVCPNCKTDMTQSENNSTKKSKFGKYLGITLLVALGVFFLAFIVNVILSLAGIEASKIMTLFIVGIPILLIIFSPLIALVINEIKNK